MNVAVHAVKFGAAPEGKRAVHFKNRVSELYWNLREAMRDGTIGIPNEPRLLAQLTQLEWEQESDAKIRVHKRGMGDAGESPDRADALALALEARRLGSNHLGVWIF